MQAEAFPQSALEILLAGTCSNHAAIKLQQLCIQADEQTASLWIPTADCQLKQEMQLPFMPYFA
jgi:hypothetical protein